MSSSESSDDCSVPIDEQTLNSYKTKRQRYNMKMKLLHFLRKRHQNSIFEPIHFRTMMRKCKLDNIGKPLTKWLRLVGLHQIERVEFVPPNRFKYKPVYDIRTANDFVSLLRERDRCGLGGVLHVDIYNSLPDSKKILKQTRKSYSSKITTKDDKRIIDYRYRPSTPEKQDKQHLQKFWNKINVSNMTEKQMNTYLKKNGIKPFMADDDTDKTALNKHMKN